MSGINPNFRVPNQGASSSYSPAYGTSPQNPVAMGYGYPHNPSTSVPLYNPEAPVSPPYYPTIANDGTVIGIPVAWTRHTPEPFPVASTIEAAIAYANRMNAAIQSSVLEFQNSPLFSDAQKKGIQDLYRKYAMPIGMAHQLKALVDYRFDFILDDHKDTSPNEFESLKRRIFNRSEFLCHVPDTSIIIRTASNLYKPKKFETNKENPKQVLDNIERFLNSCQLARHTPPFQTVYETSVGDAVNEQARTIPYVFSARDLTGGRRSQSQETKRLAKNLTKAVVNRPEDMVPTAFYPASGNPASIEIINKLDTIAKKVAVIRPFKSESDEVKNQQSRMFPFNEGCYIQASLLAAINPFWDDVDEGRIFSKAELEFYLGTPITQQHYDAYFNEVLDRQAAMFMNREAASEAKETQKVKKNSGKLPSMHSVEFATTTYSESIYQVPSLLEKLEEFRRNPHWTPDVEEGINRLCTENRIPIGMGLHMIQVVGRHHEFNIDNSASMGLRADQEDDMGRPLRDGKGVYHPSRMEELKSLLRKAGQFLSYLPTKGVTISSMFNQSGCPTNSCKTIESNDPKFLHKLEDILRTIEAVGGNTPLNQAAQNVYARANNRAEITNTIFFTDGEPTDNSPSFDRSHRAPHNSIVSRQPIREFIKLLTNRDPEKIPVTIAQTTNNPKAIAWTNLCDSVCKNVNAIDDKDNEIREVRAHHGKSFPYDDNIYAMSLLLGSDNKLFDGLDEDGIFKKVALETLYGRPMSDKEYDIYYDEAYALQCAPGTEELKSNPVSEYKDGLNKASYSQAGRPESSSGGFLHKLGIGKSSKHSEREAYSLPRNVGEGSGSSTAASQEGTSAKPKKTLMRLNANLDINRFEEDDESQ